MCVCVLFPISFIPHSNSMKGIRSFVCVLFNKLRGLGQGILCTWIWFLSLTSNATAVALHKLRFDWIPLRLKANYFDSKSFSFSWKSKPPESFMISSSCIHILPSFCCFPLLLQLVLQNHFLLKLNLIECMFKMIYPYMFYRTAKWHNAIHYTNFQRNSFDNS